MAAIVAQIDNMPLFRWENPFGHLQSTVNIKSKLKIQCSLLNCRHSQEVRLEDLMSEQLFKENYYLMHCSVLTIFFIAHNAFDALFWYKFYNAFNNDPFHDYTHHIQQ